MTRKESTTKGGTQGKAEGSKGDGTKDAALARAVLALAFRTKAERRDARKGVFTRGGTVEVIQDLAHDCLSVWVYHPDILPHALPVILRAARSHIARRGFDWRRVRSLLLKLERAAAGEEGAR